MATRDQRFCSETCAKNIKCSLLLAISTILQTVAAIVACSIVVVAVTDVVKLLIRKGERERARERESNREMAGVETHKDRKQKGERKRESKLWIE